MYKLAAAVAAVTLIGGLLAITPFAISHASAPPKKVVALSDRFMYS